MFLFLFFSHLLLPCRDAPPDQRFHRLKAPVVFFRACTEDSSLFNFRIGTGGGSSLYIHGSAWAHACDNVEIIDCGSNHFTLLMPNDVIGGDLETTVVPVMSEWLRRFWDLPPPPPEQPEPAQNTQALQALAEAEAAWGPCPLGGADWVQGTWDADENLPIWAKVPVALSGDVSDILADLDSTGGSVVLGLNILTRNVTQDSPTVILLVHDFLEASAQWPDLALKTQLPVFGLHVSPEVLAPLDSQPDGQSAGQSELASLAAKYLAAAAVVMPQSPTTNVIVAGSSHLTGMLALAMSTQLRLADRSALSVLVDISADPSQQLEPTPHASPVYQALFSKVLTCSRAPQTWSQFVRMLAAVPSFDSQLELVSTNRPREMAPVAWDSEVDHALRQALALFSLACSYLPVPVIAPGLLGSAAAQHAVRAVEELASHPLSASGRVPL